MMTAYDYGCEKHYGVEARGHSKSMTREEMEAMKKRINEAARRAEGKA